MQVNTKVQLESNLVTNLDSDRQFTRQHDVLLSVMQWSIPLSLDVTYKGNPLLSIQKIVYNVTAKFSFIM